MDGKTQCCETRSCAAEAATEGGRSHAGAARREAGHMQGQLGGRQVTETSPINS